MNKTDDNKATWIESMRGPHESNKEWTIKKAFLSEHYDKYDEERLKCLAQCFINIEMYGVGYPEEVMKEIQGLSNELLDVRSYREEKERISRKRQEFVKAGNQGNDSQPFPRSQGQGPNRFQQQFTTDRESLSQVKPISQVLDGTQ